MSHDWLKCKCKHPMGDHSERINERAEPPEPLGVYPCGVEGCLCKDFDEQVGE